VPDRLDDVPLTRPEAAVPGPLDEQFYDIVERRFRRVIRDNPIVGNYFGIHTEDHRLGDGSRDALLGELADEKAHLAAVEALDPAGLSDDARFERDLELHNLRRVIFDNDVVRTWERRSTALDNSVNAAGSSWDRPASGATVISAAAIDPSLCPLSISIVSPSAGGRSPVGT